MFVLLWVTFYFIDREWINKTIAQNDKDGDGGISLEEFIEMNIRGKVKLTHIYHMIEIGLVHVSFIIASIVYIYVFSFSILM